jgi:hypothetical protein
VPADGSWLETTAAEPAFPPAAAALASGPSMAPRFGVNLDFVGSLNMQLRAEVVGETPQGFRINFFVVSGESYGPRLRGRILPGGSDWVCVRPDGVAELNARVTHQMDDGALIHEQAGGIVTLGAAGYTNLVRGVYTGVPPVFASQSFGTADPRWKWMNTTQFYGFGRVFMDKLRLEVDVFTPTIAWSDA